MPSYLVYVLRSLRRRFVYVGWTRNLQRRLAQHNGGFVVSTRPYVPLEIIAYVVVSMESKARELERHFKTESGRALLKKRILPDEVTLHVT